MSKEGEQPQDDAENASQSDAHGIEKQTLAPPESDALPDAVSAYRKILGQAETPNETDGKKPEAFSYWSYPSFDASFAEDQESKPLDAPDELTAFSRSAASVADKAKKQKKRKKKKSDKLKLHIAHQTTGRVRMKVAGAKGDPETLQEIAETFRLIPGIQQVGVNAVTGSIVLEYDETNQAAFNDRLTRSMASHGSAMLGSEFDELARKIENEAEFLAQRSEAARAIVDFFKQLDRDIKLATHNVVDLKIVLAVGVIALTVFEIGAHAATPVWLTLSIFTFNHFLELRAPGEEEQPALAMPP
jgi:hypothetical protein